MNQITLEEAYKRASELINQSHDGGGNVGDDIQLRFYVDGIWKALSDAKLEAKEADKQRHKYMLHSQEFNQIAHNATESLKLWKAKAESAEAERDGLKAARIAYASEFDGDVGSIHKNIKALKDSNDKKRKTLEFVNNFITHRDHCVFHKGGKPMCDCQASMLKAEIEEHLST